MPDEKPGDFAPLRNAAARLAGLTAAMAVCPSLRRLVVHNLERLDAAERERISAENLKRAREAMTKELDARSRAAFLFGVPPVTPPLPRIAELTPVALRTVERE